MKTELSKHKISYQKAIALGPTRFAKRHLFPAMERENGNGFAMEDWNYRIPPDYEHEVFMFDEVERPAPSCGMVMCVGGTMQVLTGFRRLDVLNRTERLGRLLRLTPEQAHGLFYNWDGANADFDQCQWSAKNQRRFQKAKTPLEKVKITEDEILLAIKTKGKSLEVRTTGE